MRIALLSDTHSYMDQDILDLLEGCDEVWHAGDIGSLRVTEQLAEILPVRAIYGNIDDHKIRQVYPRDLIFTVDEVKVWMTHIGAYPPRYHKAIRPRLDEIQPDLFICGHSHILRVIYDKERSCLHMNPGACGRHGFHKIRTMLRFDIDGDRVHSAQVIELGSRSAKAGSALDRSPL